MLSGTGRGAFGGQAMRTVLAAVLAGSLGASPIASAQTQTAPAPSTAPSPAPTPAAPPAGRATAPAQPATPMKQMTVSALTDKDLVGARDNEVGDIERVVESNADKRRWC